MTTKAMSVSSGSASKKDCKAFNPPADAPMPTTVNPLCWAGCVAFFCLLALLTGLEAGGVVVLFFGVMLWNGNFLLFTAN